ncbi:MAG TPA: T9SS type A sorting domain-containing protein [Ignavibacteriaceae bacterium]|nr:T9SS type A sorting domain-containing protein [Ignavibacteriaceae bacterium]
MLFLSNSTFLLSQPQNITTPLNEGVTSERDYSYYNRLYSEFNLNQSVDSNLTLLSHFAIGPCFDVVVEGNLAYSGNGGYFQVVDISNPSQPVIMGEVLLPEGIVYDIEINGSFAYLLWPFTVINISDPYNPQIIFSQIIGNAAQVLEIDSNYAYLGDFSAIRIIDIIDPYNPVTLGASSVTGEFVSSVAVMGDYMYATTYNGFVIDIFNISNKNNPIWVNGYDIWSPGGGLFIKDSTLYAGTGLSPKFKIFNISNPTQPQLIAGLDYPSIPLNISVVDSVALFSIGTAGLAAVNINNNNNPTEIFNIHSTYSPFYIKNFSDDSSLLISFYSGFDIFNINDITSPDYLGSYFTSHVISKMDIKNNLLYCSAGYGGLKIIDYSDPEKLEVVGQYQNTSPFRDVEVGDSIAYVLTDHSLVLINIKETEYPYFVSEFNFTEVLTFSRSILLIDSIIIAPIREKYLGIIDVTDPYLPTLVDSFPSYSDVVDLAIRNEILYSAENVSIQIYDLSTLPPQNIGSITGGASFSVIADGEMLFSYMDGLSIHNIENPAVPVFINNYQLYGSGISYADIVKFEEYISIALGNNLEIINVSNPTDPYLVAYSRNSDAYGLATTGSLIFKGNIQRGILVYNADFISSIKNETNSLPTQLALFNNYPNPFNPLTIIRYKIPQRSFVSMKVYDVLGNLVTTIVNEEKSAGSYEVEFNGTGLTSGIYLYQLHAGSLVVSKKMILLK